MSVFLGGSYTLNPKTCEYELVERTFDPAESAVSEQPTPASMPDPALAAKRASKPTSEE